jgi:hypothetical protein
LGSLDGIYVLALESEKQVSAIVPQARIIPKIQASNVTCIPKPVDAYFGDGLDYNDQTCTIIDKPKISIRVFGFGNNATATRWNGATIRDLVTWLVDAQTI